MATRHAVLTLAGCFTGQKQSRWSSKDVENGASHQVSFPYPKDAAEFAEAVKRYPAEALECFSATSWTLNWVNTVEKPKYTEKAKATRTDRALRLKRGQAVYQRQYDAAKESGDEAAVQKLSKGLVNAYMMGDEGIFVFHDRLYQAELAETEVTAE